ncbi:porin [Cupriavidus necator]|uniref:porin n=1 Tax=Cupriavidus necator TaxID=106590 RepID=UPI003ED05B0F
MKKTLIALSAFSTLMGSAQAQTTVTLYGVVDASIEYVNNYSATGATAVPGAAESRVALLSGAQAGSRWGIRGVEELGKGYNAFFVLENGFTLDDGKASLGGRLFGRQAFLGVGSHYGKLSFGRQYVSMFEALANFQVAAYQPLYEPVVAQNGRFFREDNTVKYSGTFGGLNAVAHWSFGVDTTALATTGEVPGRIRDGAGWGVGSNYTAGPFGIGVGFDQVMPATTPGADGKNQRAAIAASYAVTPNLRFVAGYRWGQSKNPAGMVILRDDYYWIGGSYRVTQAWQVTAGYYYDNVKQVTNPVTNALLGNIANPWQVQVINNYYLSKRTNLYLTTAYAKNASLNFDTSVGGLGTGYYLGAGKNSMFGAALGIRHVF